MISKVVESHVLEPGRSTFFKFDEVGAASRSRFFRFGGVGNRSPYCFWRLRYTLNYFTFYFFIYPPDSRGSDGGTIDRTSNYPDLLPEMPRYCCPIKNIYFFFYFYKDMSEIYNCFPRPPSGGKYHKSVFPKDTTEYCE